MNAMLHATCDRELSEGREQTFPFLFAVFTDLHNNMSVAVLTPNGRHLCVLRVFNTGMEYVDSCKPSDLPACIHPTATVSPFSLSILSRILCETSEHRRHEVVQRIRDTRAFTNWAARLNNFIAQKAALASAFTLDGPNPGVVRRLWYTQTEESGVELWGRSCHAHIIVRMTQPAETNKTARLVYLLQSRPRKQYTAEDLEHIRAAHTANRAPAAVIAGFPGGEAEPQDTSPMDTALREAAEEGVPITVDEFNRALSHAAVFSSQASIPAASTDDDAPPSVVPFLTDAMSELEGAMESTKVTDLPQVLPGKVVVFVLDLWKLHATHESNIDTPQTEVLLPNHDAQTTRRLIQGTTPHSTMVTTPSEIAICPAAPRGYAWVGERTLRRMLHGVSRPESSWRPGMPCLLGTIKDGEGWVHLATHDKKGRRFTKIIPGTTSVVLDKNFMHTVCYLAKTWHDFVPRRPTTRPMMFVNAFHATPRAAMLEIAKAWAAAPRGVGILRPSTGGMLGPGVYVTTRAGVRRFMSNPRDYYVIMVRIAVGRVAVQQRVPCTCSATCSAVGACHDGSWARHSDCISFQSAITGACKGSELVVADPKKVCIKAVYRGDQFLASTGKPLTANEILEGTAQTNTVYGIPTDAVKGLRLKSVNTTADEPVVMRRRRVRSKRDDWADADAHVFNSQTPGTGRLPPLRKHDDAKARAAKRARRGPPTQDNRMYMSSWVNHGSTPKTVCPPPPARHIGDAPRSEKDQQAAEGEGEAAAATTPVPSVRDTIMTSDDPFGSL